VSGRNFEYAVCEKLKKEGWVKIRREYGSKGIMDIVAIRAANCFEAGIKAGLVSMVAFVQCKHKKHGSAIRSMSQSDKNKLVSFSNACGARAIFAYNNAKHKIVFEYLN
jgi:Holliday junction resolvase